MTFLDDLLNDKQYYMATLGTLISDEGKRICANNLASQKEVNNFVYKAIKAGCNLSDVHRELLAVKLPGDFNKLAGDEFYKALDIPYEGEKFYDLSSLKKEKEEKPSEAETELQKALEDYVEQEEEKAEEEEQHACACDNAEDCSCDSAHADDCMCADCADATMALTSAVNDYLSKIARAMGENGNHSAAYLIERTMRSINGLNN